jgi:hypothetical protein
MVRIFILHLYVSHLSDKLIPEVFIYRNELHTPQSLLEWTRSQLDNQRFSMKIFSKDFSTAIGEVIFYTGAGGNDPVNKRKIADQNWTYGDNAGLSKSMDAALPVQVVRDNVTSRNFVQKGYRHAETVHYTMTLPKTYLL